MIVVTGAAGFIGSCMVSYLNQHGHNDVVVVDDFSNENKNKNLEGKSISAQVHRNNFFEWIDNNANNIDFIIHLGARTDTTEFNKEIFDELNLNYSKKVWQKAVEYGILQV